MVTQSQRKYSILGMRKNKRFKEYILKQYKYNATYIQDNIITFIIKLVKEHLQFFGQNIKSFVCLFFVSILIEKVHNTGLER